MSLASEQFEQLKSLLTQLEESAINHPVNSVETALEALELAAAVEMYESEMVALLLQTSANLMECVKEHELDQSQLLQLIGKLRDVGYTDEEISIMLALDSTDHSNSEIV